MKLESNEVMFGMRNPEIVKLNSAKNVSNKLKNLNTSDLFTSSKSLKATANKNVRSSLKSLALGVTLGIATLFGFNQCTPEEDIIIDHTHYVAPDQLAPTSAEDIEFSQKAREQLETNPALLQSCIEYINDHNMFNGAEGLLSEDYPVEWKINVVISCIMGDADMKEWFAGLIG